MTTITLKALFVFVAILVVQSMTLFSADAQAQPQIRITLNVDAYPEPYLDDWKDKKSTVIVTIVNTGAAATEIVLDAQLSLDGKNLATTQREKMRRIVAVPGASQYFAEDVFPQNAISFQGNADQTAIRTGMLPAGRYSLCVRALDATTFAELAPPVCKDLNITSYQAPILIQPEDKASLDPKKRITFTWSPVTPKRPGVSYKVQMFEVLQGQTPTNAFRANRPILEKTGIAATQLLYPSDYEMPQAGKQYVWGVYALDDRGNAVGGSGGLGGPNAFVISGPMSDTLIDTRVADIDPPQDTTQAYLSDWVQRREITLISPTSEKPPTSSRPAFEWEDTHSESEGTYTLTISSLKEDGDIGEVVFKREGIRRKMMEFPAEMGSLDSGRAYAWKIELQDAKKKLLDESPSELLVWPPGGLFCILMYGLPTTINTCLGSTSTLNGSFFIIAGSGPTTWQILQGSSVIASGTGNNINYTFPLATSPGVRTYQIKMAKGLCLKQRTLTVRTYPTVSQLTSTTNTICSGGEAQLSVTSNPPGLPIIWTYQERVGSSGAFGPMQPWLTTVNPVNTNTIVPVPCNDPYIERKYNASISLTPWALPPPPSTLSCAQPASTIIRVDCPTNGGVISASITSGHTLDNGKICSDKNQDGTADYDLILDLAWSGGIGSVQSWSVSPSTADQITGTSANVTGYRIHAAGTYTFKVEVDNGECTTKFATWTVIVKDPPPPPVIEIIAIEDVAQNPVAACGVEVCPHDDAILHLTGASTMQGINYSWYFAPNQSACPPLSATPSAPWVLAGGGVNYIEHNTNSIGPFDANWQNMWWMVVATDPEGVCDAVVGTCCVINIIQPPCRPLITADQKVKCESGTAELTATMTGSNCGPVESWQWYLNGMPYGAPIPGAQSPTINTPHAGNYYLVANGPCESTQSEPLTISNHKTTVLITGDCCPPPGKKVTLTAEGSSTCGSGGTYVWSNGQTGPSINVAPSVTTTYTVTYTDSCGCTAQSSFTITICND